MIRLSVALLILAPVLWYALVIDGQPPRTNRHGRKHRRG